MTEHKPRDRGEGDEPPTPVRFTDKRRIDPETGELRAPVPDDVAGPHGDPVTGATGNVAGAGPADELTAAQALAAEHREDLQRLQAEYVNYRRRVDRDRALAHELAVLGVVEALLPVLDDIDLARLHGELDDGPFGAIAEKLEATLARFGWERYGAAGEVFDPTVHEALMHSESDDVTEPTVVQVLQPGHRIGERIVRAARVSVQAPTA